MIQAEGTTPPVLNVTYCLPASTTTYDLDISVDPSGGGTTNPSAGIHSYSENTVVNISATPAAGYVFDSWSGACTGTGACSVTMSAAKSVIAHFAVAHKLTVAILTDVGGPGGSTDPAVGDHWYKAGTVVSVTATANTGYHFAVWSGGTCSGTDPNVCSATMNADRTVEANFAIDLVALGVTFPGTGSGTVTSAPAGISCSSAPCSSSFAYNSSVTLTAAPTLPGSVFTGWGGDCTGSSSTCSLTMTVTRNVTATFTADSTPPSVTIEKAAGQADPTSASPINFTVVFSESVTDFATGDVKLSSSTTPGTLVGTVTGSGTTYNVAVSGMTGSGNVIASIDAGVAHDAAANPNTASTSLDNSVTYNHVPRPTLDGAAFSQAFNASTTPAPFTVTTTSPVPTGSGANRLMLVGVSWNSNTAAATITGITYSYGAGPTILDLHQIISTKHSVTANYRYAAIWYLLNPPSGETGTVTVTFSASVPSGTVVGVQNFAGVDQTTDPATWPALGASSPSNNTTPTVTLTTLTGNELVFDTVFVGGNPPATMSANSGQAESWNATCTPTACNTRGGASTKPATASTTMSWTAASSSMWVISAIGIKPAVPAVSHTVHFDANSGSGTMSDQTSSVPANLTANAFTKTGYSFAGWNTVDVGGGTAYADGAQYDFSANITLYAQWSLNPPGAFGKSGPTNHATGLAKSLTLSWSASAGAAYYEICFLISTGCYNWTGVGNNLSVPIEVPDYGTTYYWQVVARNGAGYALADGPTNADYWDFTTGSQSVVTTQAVTSITQTTATGNGNVTTLGVPNPTQHGVVWGTSANPTIMNSKTTEGPVSASGPFTSSITGLTAGTTYHVRAYASNDDGPVYGEDVTFITLPGSFSKTAPTDGATNQSLSLSLTWGASTGVTSYSVCIETTNLCNGQQPTGLKTADYWINVGSARSYAPPSLVNNQTYYWQVKAVNISGTTYANTQGTTWSFTTVPASAVTVTFDSNYPYVAGGSGTMSPESFTPDVAKALTANAFSDTGYTFAGWGTAPAGPVVYLDGQSITINSSMTLYAQWTANTLTVTFNSNYPYVAGGSGIMSSESFTAGTAKALTANGFSDTGYTFAGWGTVPGGPVVYTNSQSITIYSSMTLYAQWTANSLTVTFNSNYPYVAGGSGSMSSESFTAGTAKALTANGFSDTGYTFAGWGTAPGGPVVYSNSQSITIYSSVTLYAQWTANSLTVTFNSNYPYVAGGSGSMSSESFTAGTAKALTANGFSDTGYTFAGWGTAPGGPVVYTDGESITIYTSTTLYAQWTANSLTVTFNSNYPYVAGGSGSMSSESFTAGTAKALTANGFSDTGYTFAGWGTAPGGPVVYTNSQSITIYTSTTLYAQWTANTLTVTFNANGGTGSMSSESFTAGTAKALTANGFSNSGFTFAGWGTALGGPVVYTDGEFDHDLHFDDAVCPMELGTCIHGHL